jgi:hypothetical protein
MLNIGPSGAKVNTDISATLLKQCADNIIIKSNADVYTKRYTQLNSFGRAVTNYLVSSPETINTNSIGNFVHSCLSGHKVIKISCVECVVNLCESHIAGFNVKENLKQSFVELFRGKPAVIPCERFDYMYFGGHYNSGAIDTTVTLNFQNTKAVVILFPRYITEISCYRNPLMSDLSVQFDNRQYPPNPANTLSVEFLKANLQCAG